MTTRQIHIAFMVGSLRLGGAERMMIHTANQLSNHARVSFLALTRGDDLKNELQNSVRLVSLEKKKSLSAIPALLKFLKHEKPDVLISTQIHINLIAMIMKVFFHTKTKNILREATSLGSHFILFKDIRSKLVKILVRKLYPKADLIIAICNAVKNNLLEHHFAKPHQIAVIYNPVVNSNFSEGIKEQVDHEFFHAGVPVIISVGRLTPSKNFALLIRAFAQLNKKHDSRLIIIGDGTEREKLDRLIVELQLSDKIKLAGKILNPYPYLKKASVYVLSSLYEGLPNALIEAMACGLQLVSVDCPGGSREILLNGALGKLVPINNVHALADAIEEAMQKPVPQKLLIEGATRFEAQKISLEYLTLVKNLLEK